MLVTDERIDKDLQMSEEWRPLAGAELLERLRVTGRPRPALDPTMSRRLHDRLDEALESCMAPELGSSPVVVTKDRLTQVLTCEAHHVASQFGERRPSQAMACGALIDSLFRQLVVTGRIENPMADGLAALTLDDHQRVLVEWINQLPTPQRSELAMEVERQAAGLVARWPALSPGWLPRTQEPIKASLAEGRVLLSARIDLAIGRPAVDHASVGIVELKSGKRRAEHRADLHFYALIEALRSPAPPFMVATYYSRTGELDVEPVSEDLLVAAARRTIAGAEALLRLATGAEAQRTPNPLCGWCDALPTCGPGQERTGTSIPQDGSRGNELSDEAELSGADELSDDGGEGQ
ncbi:MAG TPA: PD-(D/E)XK nuclease family protein [Acidimicrobiales bacterium]|nr:PD-(D/E)XK nuclease family protein [Acidimicrobiales bacterium]